jgi:hypothetical protein
MPLILTIAVIWFALSLPLAVLAGKSIKLGMAEPATRIGRSATRRRSRGTHIAPAR